MPALVWRRQELRAWLRPPEWQQLRCWAWLEGWPWLVAGTGSKGELRAAERNWG